MRRDTRDPQERPVPPGADVHQNIKLPPGHVVGPGARIHSPNDVVFIDNGDVYPWTMHRGAGTQWYISAGCQRDRGLNDPEPDWTGGDMNDPDGEFPNLRHQWWLEAKELADGRA